MSFDAERFHRILTNDHVSETFLAESRYTDADLDAYEERFEVRLPDAYRWVRLNYPGLKLGPRAANRLGRRDEFLQLGLFFPLATATAAGTYGQLDAEREGLDPAMVDWERHLLTHSFCENSGDSDITFDYAFDATNPPVVELDHEFAETSWRKEATNIGHGQGLNPLSVGRLSFVADSFVDLIELPRSDGAGEIGPEQQREQEWVAWRNERLQRFIVDGS